MIPRVDKNSIRVAMRTFDSELRSSPDWVDWEDNKSHKYAIRENGRNYPVKKIISMATGVPVGKFSGGKGSNQANEYIRSLEFAAVDLFSSQKRQRQPDWTREQHIVALDFYLRHREKMPSVGSDDIRKLREIIQAIGRAVGHKVEGTYRNAAAVYAELWIFRDLDPAYRSTGRRGLPGASHIAREVWNEFANDPKEGASLAAVIISELNNIAAGAGAASESDEVGAWEGSILARVHRGRERDQALVKRKKAQVLKTLGALICEVCSFNFATVYGERGADFIECHHKTPLALLIGRSETKLSDLALVCANCHRMIHAKADGLSIDALRKLITTR